MSPARQPSPASQPGPGAERNLRPARQPVSDPARAVWKAMQALVLDNERRKEVCEELGMSFIRVRALRRLSAGSLTQRQLATSLTCDPPYTTLVIDDLEARGLVERQPGREDRRTKLVALTPAGREAAERAEAILATPPPRLASLSLAELETLRSLLVRCLPTDA